MASYAGRWTMSAVATTPETVSAHQGWRVLLWLVPMTMLWLAISYALPWLGSSGFASTATRLAIHVTIALGLWLALERTELAPGQRLGVWLTLMVPYTLWLAAMWSAAINGFFAVRALPPRVPLAIFLPVILLTPLLLTSKRIGQVLDAMPAEWLVGLQVYRVFGGSFLVGWALGVIPGIFGIPAGVGDVTTGLLALPAAIALASGTAAGRRAAIAWNVLGLCDFAIAVSIGLITAAGPLQLIVPSIPNPTAGLYPTVLVPAFVVPSSILLHALSLRQIRRRAKRSAAEAHSATGSLSLSPA